MAFISYFRLITDLGIIVVLFVHHKLTMISMLTIYFFSYFVQKILLNTPFSNFFKIKAKRFTFKRLFFFFCESDVNILTIKYFNIILYRYNFIFSNWIVFQENNDYLSERQCIMNIERYWKQYVLSVWKSKMTNYKKGINRLIIQSTKININRNWTRKKKWKKP